MPETNRGQDEPYSVTSLLDSIGALTEEMLSKAGLNAWEELADIESKRRKIIDTLFEMTLSSAESERVARAIMDLLAIDTKIISVCEENKKEILALYQKSMAGRQALSAYHRG